MSVFELPGDRTMVMMTSGNLSISQSIRQLIADSQGEDGRSIWNVATMHEAARIVGDAVRQVHAREAKALAEFGIDFNVSIIFGGQIGGERCRLFQIYSAGNFIEAHDENTYFQIGEAKYGKPIIDRVVGPATSLDDAAKCALISMDSTLRSNVSVGLPLDLLVYETGALGDPFRHHRRAQSVFPDDTQYLGPPAQARLRRAGKSRLGCGARKHSPCAAQCGNQQPARARESASRNQRPCCQPYAATDTKPAVSRRTTIIRQVNGVKAIISVTPNLLWSIACRK
jgi:predicted proteasome-type protease